MNMACSLIAGLAALLLLDEGALACRTNPPPDQRIERGWRNKEYKAVALARVLRARSEDRGGEQPGWSAEVEVTGDLVGATQRRQLELGRTGSSASCDDGIAKPMPGDVWILYFREQKGEAVLGENYPIDVARTADPRIAGILSR